jgi:hypothetical protein
MEKDFGYVLVTCRQTGKKIRISKKLLEQMQNEDESVADKEFTGVYVSPGFLPYRSRRDFYMLCED